MLLNKQVFGGNLKGAGSVRQDLPMYNLDLGNIAENKRSPTLSVRFLEYPCETAPLFFLLVNGKSQNIKLRPKQ